MSNLCIIPARGGSKRIPRKNIKEFLGKPIIAYSIEVAINSGMFDEVMVSTDDREIAEIAKEYGASVPFFRSKEASNDFATLLDVIEEVKSSYKKLNISFDNICCILPTAPFISTDDLQATFDVMIDKKVDSVRPIVQFSYPIQRALKLVDEKLEMFNPEYRASRSQDLEPTYHDAGLFYWMSYDKTLVGENKYGYIINELYAQDIDTPEDWEVAEIKYNILKSRRNSDA